MDYKALIIRNCEELLSMDRTALMGGKLISEKDGDYYYINNVLFCLKDPISFSILLTDVLDLQNNISFMYKTRGSEIVLTGLCSSDTNIKFFPKEISLFHTCCSRVKSIVKKQNVSV